MKTFIRLGYILAFLFIAVRAMAKAITSLARELVPPTPPVPTILS